MKKALAAVLMLGLITGAASTAAARPYAPGGVTAPEVAEVLRSKGLPVEITKDSEGDPTIASSSNDVNWRVYFYSCSSGRCKSIQFSAGFDLTNGMTYAKINEWNFTKRFSRASLDDEMDPFIRYDIDAETGFTSEALNLGVETWQLVLPTFADFIGFSN